MRSKLGWIALATLLLSLNSTGWAEKSAPAEKQPQQKYDVLTPGARLVAGEPGDSDFIIADKDTPLPPPPAKVIVQPAAVANQPTLNEKTIPNNETAKTPTSKPNKQEKSKHKQQLKSQSVKMVDSHSKPAKVKTTATAKSKTAAKAANKTKKLPSVAKTKISKQLKLHQANKAPATVNKKLAKTKPAAKKNIHTAKAAMAHTKKLAQHEKSKITNKLTKKALKTAKASSSPSKKLALLGKKAKAGSIKQSMHVAKATTPKYPNEPTLVSDQQDMLF